MTSIKQYNKVKLVTKVNFHDNCGKQNILKNEGNKFYTLKYKESFRMARMQLGILCALNI